MTDPAPGPAPLARHLPLIFASTFFGLVSYSALVVALPFRFQELHLSVVQYGTALALYALGMLVTEGLWGAVAFRVARRYPLGFLGVAVMVLIVLIGIATSYPALLALLVLYGALAIFPIPLGRWLSVTALGPGTAGRGAGRYVVFFGAGIIVGASLGPLLFVTFGYLADAILSAVAMGVSVLLLVWIPWSRVPLPPRTARLRRDLPAVFTRPFAIAAALVTIYFIAFSLTSSFLQYYSVDLFGGTPADSGYVIGAARTTQMVAGFLLGYWVDRWGPGRSAPFGFLLLLLGALATFAAQSFDEMVAATLLFATGTGWLSATLLPLALERVPTELQGATVGVFGSFEDLGLLVGPLVISVFYSSYGPRSIFPLVAGIALAGALLALATRRRAAPASGEGPPLPAPGAP